MADDDLIVAHAETLDAMGDAPKPVRPAIYGKPGPLTRQEITPRANNAIDMLRF